MIIAVSWFGLFESFADGIRIILIKRRITKLNRFEGKRRRLWAEIAKEMKRWREEIGMVTEKASCVSSLFECTLVRFERWRDIKKTSSLCRPFFSKIFISVITRDLMPLFHSRYSFLSFAMQNTTFHNRYFQLQFSLFVFSLP